MNKLFLLVIFLLSFLVRFFALKNTPLLWDEASLGYNAYSIIKTGKDEYGQFLPLIFKSFGDYKPGLYVYLSIPFVYLFGLNLVSVRLASVIIGSLTPVFLFLLINKIFPKSKSAYLSSLILVFNPINIHFSRGAWETNLLTFELVLASYFFYQFLSNYKYRYLFFSAITFGLSLYTYQAAKMISLFLIISLFISNFKPLISKSFKQIFISFVVPLFILTIPIIFGLLFGQDSNRLQVVSLFSYPRPTFESNQIISESNTFDYSIFHSQPVFFLRNFLSRYFNNFSPKYLLFSGDWQNLRHSTPYIGIILYPSIIFLLIGLFNKSPRKHLFFYLWLLLAPIPSALTRDSISAVRAMSFSIPLVYFIGLGLSNCYQQLPKIFSFFIFITYLLSFVYYSDLYLNHLVKKDPVQFLYGYQQAIEYLKEHRTTNQSVNITNFYGQPYIFYLFFSSYPPENYQKQALLSINSLDTGEVLKIDNITFANSDFSKIKNQKNTLTIFSHDEILRQGIDKSPEFSKFIPLSPINNISTFYAYSN